MKAELNKKESQFEVTLSPKKEDWKAAQAKAEEKLLKTVKVKGFREGKVPAEIAKKHVAKANIYNEALESMLKALSQEAAKEVPEDLMILDAPFYAINKISDADLEVKFMYPVYPEIELADYKKLDIEYKEEKVDAKIVNDEIERLRIQQSMLTPKEGKIEKGNVVTFDFEGFVDGKAFDGGKAEKYELEIGSNRFIPGFEDQMIGLESGTNKDIKVTFPKDYFQEDLKNKEATFKIKVHDIKVKEVPALDDEFAKTSGVPGINTLKELKDYIKSIFVEQTKQGARAKFQREAFDKIISKSKGLVLPKAIITKEMLNARSRFEADLKQQGLDIKQYMQFTGNDEIKLEAQFREQAEKRLYDSLVFAEIAKKEKIEIKEADYEKEYEKYAKVYKQSLENIKGMITKEQMQIPMTNDKVIDSLIKYNSK